MSGNYPDAPPMSKVKSTKDPKIEEDAIVKVMHLAICGAITKPRTEEDIYNVLNECFKLFKDAGLIK